MINKNESLAKDIYEFCKKKGLWGDNCIYFNNKAWDLVNTIVQSQSWIY